ncbi:MAG: ABC transporter substrate-binding protein [Anaerolineae bacterium]|nr:ABC transporter substrate-binding protein [Anaerolineae bacterium]
MKKLVVLFSILALAGMIVGSQLLAQDATPKSGGVLKAAYEAEWTGLDPHLASTVSSFFVLANVVEPLTTYDNDMKLAPMLATEWSQSEDGLTWTFTLREGVKFHNGADMTADEVVWSMNRIINPDTGSGRVASVGGADAVWEKVDTYTVSVTTPEPNAILPQLLAGYPQAVMHPDSVNDEGLIVIPVGTGPFTVQDLEGTTSLKLVKNPDYWQEGLPYLDEVDVTVISEDAPREAALLGGEVDWVARLAPQSVVALEGTQDLVIDTVPALHYQYIGLNTEREPLNDVRVRQAIAYAVDREQICAAAEFGLCTVIEGPTGPSSPWYNDYAPYSRDVEKAKELLAEAGYPNGFEMQLMPTSAFEETVRAAQVVQANLAEAGIQTTILAPEWSEWLELEGGGQYDGYICSWNGLTDGDAYYYLQQRTGEVFNFTGYSNPQFDQLVDDARTVSDFDTRYQLYDEANKMLVDDAPYVYFYNQFFNRAYKPYVKGYVLRADNTNLFTTTWLDQ